MKFNVQAKRLMIKVYDFFRAEAERGRPFYSIDRYMKSTSKALGVSTRALKNVLKKRDSVVDTVQVGVMSKASQVNKLDNFQKNQVRQTITKLYSENKYMSLKILQKHLEKQNNLSLTKYTLWRLLHSFGYRYKKIAGENRKVLCERSDIVRLRNQFLRTIQKKRDAGYEPVYLDETWVNASHTASSQWVPDGNDGSRRKLPLGKGERLIILHAGCASQGFLPGCDLVFRAKAKDNRDYHTEMNGDVFFEWVQNKLVPALPKKSLIVMDNAPYHSVQDPNSKNPTSNNRKGDMIAWLQKFDIPYPSKATKPQLYEIIKTHKHDPVYKVDTYIKSRGHDILRLPPYHCDLNPIEMIWGILKGDVARSNTTFKLRDVEGLVTESLGKITVDMWQNCVTKVVNDIEAGYWSRDGLQQATVAPLVVSISSDCDTTDDEVTGNSD